LQEILNSTNEIKQITALESLIESSTKVTQIRNFCRFGNKMEMKFSV